MTGRPSPARRDLGLTDRVVYALHGLAPNRRFPMLPSETTWRMETAVTALAKNERDQLEAGLASSAAETGHALADARKVLEKLKGTRSALTLPTHKSPRSEADLTKAERTAFAENDPVAGTEYREMATLFVQMHEFVCDVLQALGLRALRLEAAAEGSDEDAPSHPPA